MPRADGAGKVNVLPRVIEVTVRIIAARLMTDSPIIFRANMRCRRKSRSPQMGRSACSRFSIAA